MKPASENSRRAAATSEAARAAGSCPRASILPTVTTWP